MKDSPAASMMPAAMVAGQLGDEHTVGIASAQGLEGGLSVLAAHQFAAAYRDDDALSRAWCESVCVAHLRLTADSSGSAEGPVPGKRWLVFGSLDYIYVPVADVDGEALRYVQTLGAELVWKVRGMGTTVACLRVGEPGPAILLSGHLPGPGAILVYRVQDYAATVAQLRVRGVAVHELEIPHGPCATFTIEAGQRNAVYQLVRPDAVHLFDGRVDP